MAEGEGGGFVAAIGGWAADKSDAEEDHDKDAVQELDSDDEVDGRRTKKKRRIQQYLHFFNGMVEWIGRDATGFNLMYHAARCCCIHSVSARERGKLYPKYLVEVIYDYSS